jgi:hypothetical protein
MMTAPEIRTNDSYEHANSTTTSRTEPGGDEGVLYYGRMLVCAVNKMSGLLDGVAFFSQVVACINLTCGPIKQSHKGGTLCADPSKLYFLRKGGAIGAKYVKVGVGSRLINLTMGGCQDASKFKQRGRWVNFWIITVSHATPPFP